MFGDLMGTMQEQQKAMKEQLAGVLIKENSDRNDIEISADGNGVLKQITISDSLLDPARKDELEDLLIIHLNNVISKAKFHEVESSKTMVEKMMPSGLSGLSNLFDK